MWTSTPGMAPGFNNMKSEHASSKKANADAWWGLSFLAAFALGIIGGINTGMEPGKGSVLGLLLVVGGKLLSKLFGGESWGRNWADGLGILMILFGFPFGLIVVLRWIVS